tara:strand:+ start:838 stop:1413 length:576 start_codon:yes stop_codon:yes gene_type:complete
MALDLKLNISTTDDCRNIIIEDSTGVYDALNNPGGWGGINIESSVAVEDIKLYIKVHHFIDEVQYNTTVNISDLINYIVFPFEGVVEGFKISLPAHVLSTEVANQLSLELEGTPEGYNALMEILEDGIYQVVVEVSEYVSEAAQFNCVCTTSKEVDAMLSNIDLHCTDCDARAKERAILAKSLLENLENIN